MSIVERARWCLAAAGTVSLRYKLGLGGMDPAKAYPWALRTVAGVLTGECDCSGFALWCCGISRFCQESNYAQALGSPDPSRIWIDTSRIHQDASRPAGAPDQKFLQVANAEPGDLIVYPDSGGHQGHVGIVSEVSFGRPSKVIHCHAGANQGSAIEETGPEAFSARPAIICRFIATTADAAPQGKPVAPPAIT